MWQALNLNDNARIVLVLTGENLYQENNTFFSFVNNLKLFLLFPKIQNNNSLINYYIQWKISVLFL